MSQKRSCSKSCLDTTYIQLGWNFYMRINLQIKFTLQKEQMESCFNNKWLESTVYTTFRVRNMTLNWMRLACFRKNLSDQSRCVSTVTVYLILDRSILLLTKQKSHKHTLCIENKSAKSLLPQWKLHNWIPRNSGWK